MAKNERLELRCNAEWLTAIDHWRAQAPGVPTRNEAIRTLVDRGLGYAEERLDYERSVRCILGRGTTEQAARLRFDAIEDEARERGFGFSSHELPFGSFEPKLHRYSFGYHTHVWFQPLQLASPHRCVEELIRKPQADVTPHEASFLRQIEWAAVPTDVEAVRLILMTKRFDRQRLQTAINDAPFVQ